MRKFAGGIAATLVAVLLSAGPAVARVDFSGPAYDILAPGEFGGLPANQYSTDQGQLYDALTPLQGHVTTADLARYYLSEKFGVQGPVIRSEQTGRPGLTILRDSHDVPHIYGKTRADVMFGSGWVAAEDRGLLLFEGLGPAYLATLDAPGITPFSLVTSARSFTPSPQAIRFVAAQENVLRRAGPQGRQVLQDLQDWADGINAYEASPEQSGPKLPKVTLPDAIAGFAFIGSIFGNGGGNEVANSDFLARLERRLGKKAGLGVFRDLREVNDPEAPTTIRKPFPYDGVPKGPTPGAMVIDPGSEQSTAPGAITATAASHHLASNFIIAGHDHSADGHPLAVMGPQLGYYYPEIVMQGDLHGGGIDAEGIIAPISPYVFIGRGRDFAWSLTSADSENEQQFLEQLCNPHGGRVTRSSTHYMYKGRCRAMVRFDAGRLGAGDGQPAREVVFYESVHGPISGTVTVHGRPYAVALDRSTRGDEPTGELALSDLDSNRVHNPEEFFQAVNHFGTTFNWPYIDSRHIAYFSSGRLPIMAPGTDPSLPTLGTGKYDWRGWLSLNAHPHQIDPRSDTLTNWNNKPAPGWGAASDNYGYGAVHRVQLYQGFSKGMDEADDVSIMNRAANQDLRTVEVWPIIRRVLNGGPAPSPLAAEAAHLIDVWRAQGSSRLDATGNGHITAPGAAVMDTAWNGIAMAVMRPVLGPLTKNLAQMISPSATPSFDPTWAGYVSKDLRTELGMKVRGRFSRRYCGNGSLKACRKALWAAIQAAAVTLSASEGPNPDGWYSSATAERIHFIPGLIPFTMSWTNRSTFQQVIEFTGHAKS
ncbi:MAG TPA: penicillin acylase family protein [Solirubrobacteraceae bacterium]|nr:penicillin acylase family protein [Solirubrobacteraceae bacterium]